MRNLLRLSGHVSLYLIIEFSFPIVQNYFNLSMASMAIIYYTIFYVGIASVCVLITELMDLYASDKFKLKFKIQDPRTTIHSRWYIFWTNFRNDGLQWVIWAITCCFVFGSHTTDTYQQLPFLYRQANHLFVNIGCLFIFDLYIYYGHVWMHWTQKYKWIHREHHETFATSGLSFHFMSFPDFCLESIFQLFSMLVVFGLLGFHPTGILQFVSYGIFNTVIVHSGWDFPFLPDPKIHHFHHLKYKGNYGIGLFDRLHSTEF